MKRMAAKGRVEPEAPKNHQAAYSAGPVVEVEKCAAAWCRSDIRSHPHPTLGESIGMAVEVARDSCTYVPPARRE